MAITNEELLERFFSEGGRDDPHWLSRSPNWTVDKETGTLSYYRGKADEEMGRSRIPSTMMATFAGHRFNGGIIVLNGDGFDDRWLTAAQADLRERAHRSFYGQQRTAIIPNMAFEGANIIPHSVKPIEITEDTQEAFITPVWADALDLFTRGADQVAHIPELVEMRRIAFEGHPGWRQTNTHSTNLDDTWEGTYRHQRVQVRFHRGSRNDTWLIRSLNVWAQPEFGQWGWQPARFNGGVNYTPKTVLREYQREHPMETAPYEYVQGWFWTENIHRLGSVVFSAITRVDGKRHRYISAFDMQEPAGLYFLAMLPDRGRCETYEDALELLAPEMVKKAREEGRNVYRQGDVFAIETKLTDEAIYDGAVTRVRRVIAMQDGTELFLRGQRPVPPAEGEMSERGTCPMCDCKPMIGYGPKARAALSIHGTGHTASEVVVKENGVTFIRGHMHHDPQIEDVSRTTPDHRPVALGPDARFTTNPRSLVNEPDDAIIGDQTWYLAIRNTVPQLRRRTQNILTDSDLLRQHRMWQVRAERDRHLDAVRTAPGDRARTQEELAVA